MLTRLARAALVAAVWSCAAHAQGLDVDLVLSGEEDRAGDVRAASLLLGPEAEILESPQDVVAAARADYTRIVGRLYARGHFGPVVSILLDGREAAEIDPLNVPAGVRRAVIRVETGPRFTFGRAQIAPLAPRTDLPTEFRPGGEASTGVIREAAGTAVDAWRETGRAKADIADQRIVARHPTSTLDVSLAVRPGPVVRFGPVSIPNPSAVRERRIRAIAGIPRGQVFDPAEIAGAEARLRRTGAFSAVAITEGDLLPGDVLPLELTLVDALPRRVGFGAELNSGTGAELSAFWLHRNLLGGAERLRFDAEVGGIGTTVDDDGEDYALSVLFRRPATFRADTDLTLTARVAREDEPNFDSDIFEGGATLTRIVNDWFTMEAGLAFRIEETEDALGTRNFEILSLPLRVEADRRDDEFDPTGGYYAEATLRPFVALGEGDDGARAQVDLRGYRGFGAEDRTVLAGRVVLGTVLAASREGTPPDYLFFSGGSNSVRGQPFESLGVEVEDGTAGGRSTAVIQSELRRAFGERFSGVAFVDAGYVAEDGALGDGDTHVGAGLGVRVRTGFGPIRLDVGAPVSGDTGDGVQLYIGIGQAF